MIHQSVASRISLLRLLCCAPDDCNSNCCEVRVRALDEVTAAGPIERKASSQPITSADADPRSERGLTNTTLPKVIHSDLPPSAARERQHSILLLINDVVAHLT
jgi:hypothetical protein